MASAPVVAKGETEEADMKLLESKEISGDSIDSFIDLLTQDMREGWKQYDEPETFTSNRKNSDGTARVKIFQKMIRPRK
jgi:hypothetical protein